MIFNIFSDPLSPKSNTVWIYSELGLSKKLFVNNKSLSSKIKELNYRWADISFKAVQNTPRIYNNLSAEMVAIAYPDFCKKYWSDKWKKPEDILRNQNRLFGEVVTKVKEARAIAKKRMS